VSDPQGTPEQPPSRYAPEDPRAPVERQREWRQVISLIEAVSSAEHEPNGKVRLTVGGETQVVTAPRGKDVDPRLLGTLRRMLLDAGLGQETG
jgi:hypothetical protein